MKLSVTSPSTPSSLDPNLVWVSQQTTLFAEKLGPEIQKLMDGIQLNNADFCQFYDTALDFQRDIRLIKRDIIEKQEEIQSKELEKLELTAALYDTMLSDLIANIEKLSQERLNQSRYKALLKVAFQDGKGEKFKQIQEKAKVPLRCFEEFKHTQELAWQEEQFRQRQARLKQEHEERKISLALKKAEITENLESEKKRYVQEIERIEREFAARIDAYIGQYFQQKQVLMRQLEAKRAEYRTVIANLSQYQKEEIENLYRQVKTLECDYQKVEQDYVQTKQEIQQHYDELQQELKIADNQIAYLYDHLISNSSLPPFSNVPDYLQNRQELVRRVCYIEKDGSLIPYMHLFVYASPLNQDQFQLSGLITDPLGITKLTLPPEKIRGVENPITQVELEKIHQADLWNIAKDLNGRFYLQFQKN